jgi:hypothetical protein
MSEQQRAATVLLPVPGPGFLATEGRYPDAWAWTSGDAQVFVYNFEASDLRVLLTGTLRSHVSRKVTLAANGSGTSISLNEPETDVPLRLEFVLHPGWNAASFGTDQPASRSAQGADRRLVAFMVRGLNVRPR